MMSNTENQSFYQEHNRSYRVEIRECIEDKEWDEFVARTPGGNSLQTSLWGRVKESLGWHPLRIIIIEQEKIMAGAQLLVRTLIPGIAVSYVPRGPIMNLGSEQLGEFLINQILHISSNKKHIFLVIQPPMNGDNIVPCLINHGFQSSTLELAPTASILIDLKSNEEQLLSQMKRQTRQNIRRSVKDGITTRIGTEEDIPTFCKLYYQTSQRQKFLPYKQNYFEKIWQTFGPSGNVSFVFTEFNGEPVSGVLLIAFGEYVHAKLLGWSGQYAEHRPNDALFWAAVQWSKSKAYHYFDFEGVSREGAIEVLSKGELPTKFHHSPDFLKYGFGGQLTIFPEAYEYIINPLIRSVRGKLDMKIGGRTLTSNVIDLFRKR